MGLEKEEREIMPVCSVCNGQGQRTHSTWTKIENKISPSKWMQNVLVFAREFECNSKKTL